jgi:hypothetical protein
VSDIDRKYSRDERCDKPDDMRLVSLLLPGPLLARLFGIAARVLFADLGLREVQGVYADAEVVSSLAFLRSSSFETMKATSFS